MVGSSITSLGFLLVVLGFVLAFVAAIIMAVKARGSGGKTRGGGILFIGPIPIIFGSDRESLGVLVVFAIILMAVVLVFMFLPTFLLTR